MLCGIQGARFDGASDDTRPFRHGRDTSGQLLSWADGMRRCVGSTGTGAVARHVGQMEHAMGMHVCFLCCKAPQAWKSQVSSIEKVGPGICGKS